MDLWFLLSIVVSVALSIAFVVVVTDEIKSQTRELVKRMDMLLGSLEECRLARIARDSQGKITEIVITGDSFLGSGKEAGR